MSALLDLVEFRPMLPGDHNFVRSSWLRSHRAVCEWAPRDAYFRLHHDVVEGLLERATCIVAASKSDADQILGWACGEPGERPLLHYAYVKQTFRRQGLGRELLRRVVGDGRATLTHAVHGSLSEKLRAAGWAIHPPLAFYLALEPSAQET